MIGWWAGSAGAPPALSARAPLVAALLVCAASLAPSPLPRHGHGAGPSVVTLLGNMAFLSSNRGWVAVSSSAGYSLFCYQTAQPPAACSQATTSIDATDDGGHTWRRMLRFTSKPFIGPNALPTTWMHLFDARHALVLPPAVQPRAMLYRIADGGATWAAFPLPR